MESGLVACRWTMNKSLSAGVWGRKRGERKGKSEIIAQAPERYGCLLNRMGASRGEKNRNESRLSRETILVPGSRSDEGD